MAVAAEAMSEDERSQFERLTGTQKSAIYDAAGRG
ncbi:MAG: hypothetical protein CM15mP100_3860 [Alphaproteobacteria bacterium]|nr:MAG: hypothetical protein CM15mP100_3860 [Alphaproteobacteria bacterium]